MLVLGHLKETTSRESTNRDDIVLITFLKACAKVNRLYISQVRNTTILCAINKIAMGSNFNDCIDQCERGNFIPTTTTTTTTNNNHVMASTFVDGSDSLAIEKFYVS